MTPKVCPYCGTRDRKPGRDSCGPCDQPVEAPPVKHGPRGRSLWSKGASYSRKPQPGWFEWRGERRPW